MGEIVSLVAEQVQLPPARDLDDPLLTGAMLQQSVNIHLLRAETARVRVKERVVHAQLRY